MKRFAVLVVVTIITSPSWAVITDLRGEVSGSNSGWDTAFSYSGSSMLSAGVFLGAGLNETTSGLSITETAGRIDVNGVSYEVSSVPEPATMALLGFGFLVILPFRRWG